MRGVGEEERMGGQGRGGESDSVGAKSRLRLISVPQGVK